MCRLECSEARAAVQIVNPSGADAPSEILRSLRSLRMTLISLYLKRKRDFDFLRIALQSKHSKKNSAIGMRTYVIVGYHHTSGL